MEQEQHIPRWVIVAVVAAPLLIVGVVAIYVQIQKTTVSFAHDFIYMTCEDTEAPSWLGMSCGQYLEARYVVVDGVLTVADDEAARERLRPFLFDETATTTLSTLSVSPRFFVYDTTTHANREVAIEEIVGLGIDVKKTAPDGTAFTSGYDYYDAPFFLFGGRSSTQSDRLVKDGVRVVVELNRTETERWWNDDFRFIGWVVDGE